MSAITSEAGATARLQELDIESAEVAAEEAVAHRDRLRAEVAVADARVRSANLLCERYRVLAAINRLRQNG